MVWDKTTAMGTPNRPVIIFDTSGINNLLSDSEAKILTIGVRSGYFVRQTETNLGEIISTGDPDQRHRLLEGARSLLTAGDCIDPYHLILERLIESYDTDPKGFDWGSPGRQSHHTGTIRTGTPAHRGPRIIRSGSGRSMQFCELLPDIIARPEMPFFKRSNPIRCDGI